MTTGTELDRAARGAENALATHNPNLPALLGGDMPGLDVLRQWADANDYATRLVAQWIFTDLVPVHHWPMPKGHTLKTFPNPRVYGPDETDEQYARRCQIAAASAAGTVLRGIPLGLPPNIALEQMASIRGTITMKTRLKHALARNHGIKTWSVRESDDEVVVAGIDRLTGDEVEIGITMMQARTAGWTTNEAYAKTPRDMLWARAMSRLLDRIAGDVLFGLASFEDVVDGGSDPEPATARTPVGVSVVESGAVEATDGRSLAALMRQSAATEPTMTGEQSERLAESLTPAVEGWHGVYVNRTVDHLPGCTLEHDPASSACPPFGHPQRRGIVDVDASDPEPPAERANVTRPQLSQIAMLLGGRHGLNGPGSVAKRGAILSALVGRPLKTTQELTSEEARTVIGHLENTDTRVLLDMAEAAPAAEPEPATDQPAAGDDPWDEPDRDGAGQ